MMDTKTTGIPYEIRWARAEEWIPAIRMIWQTFLRYEGKDYSEEGIRNFFNFITGGELYALFLKGEYPLMVALDMGMIIGAGSVRNGNHLSLLFVEEAYHHRGVGSMILGKLCAYLEKERGQHYMTVQAAPHAVDFYRKQGFRAICPEAEYRGIRVTPMRKNFE